MPRCLNTQYYVLNDQIPEYDPNLCCSLVSKKTNNFVAKHWILRVSDQEAIMILNIDRQFGFSITVSVK